MNLAMTKTADLSVEARLEAMRRADLGHVRKRLGHDQGWSEAYALRIEQDFFDFVASTMVAKAPVTPTAAVDEFWHAFILHTEDYAEFCTTYVGRFIHHRPSLPPQRRDIAFALRKLLKPFERGRSKPAICQNPQCDAPMCDGGPVYCNADTVERRRPH